MAQAFAISESGLAISPSLARERNIFNAETDINDEPTPWPLTSTDLLIPNSLDIIKTHLLAQKLREKWLSF